MGDGGERNGIGGRAAMESSVERLGDIGRSPTVVRQVIGIGPNGQAMHGEARKMSQLRHTLPGARELSRAHVFRAVHVR